MNGFSGLVYLGDGTAAITSGAFSVNSNDGAGRAKGSECDQGKHQYI